VVQGSACNMYGCRVFGCTFPVVVVDILYLLDM
jgi:hypothetical protein